MHRRIKTTIAAFAFVTVFVLGLATNAEIAQDSDSYSLRAKLISFNQRSHFERNAKGEYRPLKPTEG